MAALRASLPSRLRQLFSGQGAIGPTIKLDLEPPPKVKAIIDKVIQTPLQDIASSLSEFCWEYGKGNFHHWRPLFLHFETYFKTYLSCRSDLLLTDNLDDGKPFPKEAVLAILRVMQVIFENCHNKSTASGLEYFRLLLASTDPEILIATLETLSALVKVNPSKLHASGKLVGCGSVNSCLLSLAQGWGSKEEGLGLFSCIMFNERMKEEGMSSTPSELHDDSDKSQYRLGSTLYFEYHGANLECTSEDNDRSRDSTGCVIHIPDIHLRMSVDLSLLKQLVDEYNVPHEHRFSLLTRIKYARAFRSPKVSSLYSRICMLAFIVLVQSNDANDELVSFFANEPEYTNELVRIVKSEETIHGSIRTLAMQALGAQLGAYSSSHERARILSGSSVGLNGGNRMILLNVSQRAIFSLSNTNDPTCIGFVEALLHLYLLHVISTSSSGSASRGEGMVPTFLPLLEDTEPIHMHLVSLAVKTLKKLMDNSNTAVNLFKDLGGVELLIRRLQIEVNRVISVAGENEDSMVIGECSRINDDLLNTQKRLIRVLLKALGSASYAPANTARSQNSRDASLPATISLIFRNVNRFGGDIYSSAVTVMSEIIHKDPTSFPALHEMGLPDAFLTSVTAGVLPSSKALTCIPNGLGAICLNAEGLEAVKETSALRFLVDVFTTKKYVVAMNDGIIPLANSMEELVRHVSTLRSTGVDLIIEIVTKISAIGDDGVGSSGPTSGISMEMDHEDKENDVPCSSVSARDSTVHKMSDDQFVQLCIFHVMVLVHRMMENAETCRLFVEKSGIEALLKLLLRPSIVQSPEGMSIALHSTMVFKSFTQHHSVSLAQAFCSALKDHLKKALAGFNAASGFFLLDSKNTPDSNIFSHLFLVEFLLFLASSKDNRWVTALLTEFGSRGKDVLEDIGHLHREVMWQIALLEDTKPETDDTGASSSVESKQSEPNTNENEEHRFSSFRQHLDPLVRRRTSGWSFDSQFFDLISLYMDLSRSSGIPQRQGNDIASGLRLGASHQVNLNASADEVGTSDKKEDDKKRSYYSSCRDMVKSLSFHVTYLFQELGKVMLLPSRRRDDPPNLSPSAKTVASTFASISLEHLNFEGSVNSAGTEVSISTKCRFLGKVIDFIDAILLDKPDSSNPVILNCLYGTGVIQSVLTTFEATSQLLFAVNRPPASPMETDEGMLKQDEKEETDNAWIYGPLASYGKLMDHLVTSSLILSPSTTHLLTQPLVNGNIQFPRDAETFVKYLQSMVLKGILPVWAHSHFTDCSHDFIATVISIIRHVYSGVEVKNISSSNGGRPPGPPPSETTISTIAEMGFSRSRAEEALRQVGSDSVELAMEWLFSHPEEVQEDDELARALAMSLGNSVTDKKEDVTDENSQQIEEEMVQPPPLEDLLSTSMKLLQMKESLAFPVRDLLVMISSQNDGQYRPEVISHIVEQVKLCGSDSAKSNMLYALFHVLALIFHEDVMAREAASKAGLLEVASNILSQWVTGLGVGDMSQVPKWVTSAFLAIDRLLQADQSLNADIAELLKNQDVGPQEAIVIDEGKQNQPASPVGTSLKNVSIEEQKRLIEIACGCLKNQLSSETMHAVLLLCSTLTKTHSVAVTFLDSGGLALLLSLPTSSLFVGFDSIAATIIRHILEDPQTLQAAMESEIKHIVVIAANRPNNGRITPRSFLVNVASVISRDPKIFMQAARSVCQVEMVGERPYIVLAKDRDKNKGKEKEKEKEKEKKERAVEKEKTQAAADGSKLVLGDSGNGHVKLPDTNTKTTKVHRKPPHSFVNVIEILLDMVITFVPPFKDDSSTKVTSSLADMDIDMIGNKGKGKAVVSLSEENESTTQEASASLAKIVFVLKLLTEVLLMYSSSIHVLLRRDAEVNSFRGPPQRTLTGQLNGGIFHHILHKFVPCSRSLEKKKGTDNDWKQKLASKASQFLVASCVRSTEARKRVFVEVNNVFNDFVESSTGFRAPGGDIPPILELLTDVFAARAPTGAYISAEASATFIDVGLVRSLTRTLEMLDLDHAESQKVVTGLVKTLEVVTKEHNHAADYGGKAENSIKRSENETERATTGGDNSESVGPISHHNHSSAAGHHLDSSQTYGRSESATDDMEHDQDLNGGFAPENEDDYMHETAGDANENGLETLEIRFEIQTDDQENLADEDDDEEMSADEGDEEDDEDNDEHNRLEEDEGHHMRHPDIDQDDQEFDEDDFDDDVMEEEEDEDDEDEEDGVILRLEEGLNGINVFDHIEVFSRDHNLANEALHVMPVEVFGSRRQGHTTSIYNLLGRSGGNTTAPLQHPLLVSSSRSTPPRQTDVSRESNSNGNSENVLAAPLDAVFRSLRNGRQGHRSNLWSEDQHASRSNSSTVPEGLEDLLVSTLRRPSSEKPSDQTKPASENPAKDDVSQLQESGGMGPEIATENNNSETNRVPPEFSVAMNSSTEADVTPVANEPLQVADASHTHSHSVDMQFEQTDAAARDVEAVSQESGGSGATLGESLRSLDVEIGSADGHDDGSERQGSADIRMRRANLTFGNSTQVAVRDVSLHSVTEVSENPIQEADRGDRVIEQTNPGEAESGGSIDPAFLEALPEELRAEVLSAQQGQAPQPLTAEPQNTNDIDPEFLAALPPDIREEVLAQQAAQRLNQSQELDGQPVEMDTVSIIATFPSELREEVLLTSSHDILSNLTPALVAEANMLRERFANSYNRSLFGMYPRTRRGEGSRRGEGLGTSVDRVGGIISRRSIGNKPVEAEGAPLVSTEALKGMVRLFRVAQPLYRGSLQKLLLNLCAHNETRTALVDILVDLLMLDTRKTSKYPILSEPPHRIYGCQSHANYSRPQSFDGVPPMVSRRILETLTYLGRNHPSVAKILLQFKLPQPLPKQSKTLGEVHGKAVMMVGEDETKGKSNQEEYFSIVLLLSLLNQPLYSRSVAHLEQLLNLLDVIIDNAESKPTTPDESPAAFTEQAVGSESSTPVAEIVTGSSAMSTGSDGTSLKQDDSSKPSTSVTSAEYDSETVLRNLPQAELRVLCSLLARESLSDNAYSLAAEVLRKLVAIAPIHCHLLISELAEAVKKLTKSAKDELRIFGETEKALLTRTSSDGAAILRVLQALSLLVTSVGKKEKDLQSLSEKEHSDAMSLVHDISAILDPLWLELSSCISKIESFSDPPVESSSESRDSPYKQSGSTPPLPAGTHNILPYIESFFVMCEKLQPGQSAANQEALIAKVEEATTSAGQRKAVVSSVRTEEKQQAFVKFSDRHRKLLNAFIRQSPGLLEKSFSLMLKVPRFIDFDNKRSHFRSKIKHQHDHHHGPLRISVRRAYILEDSYNQLRMRSTQDLKGRLTVHFQGEEGIDAGGLTREWYQLLSRVIFDKGALLFTTVGNESTFQPNPNSVYQTEHLSYFKFVGRVVGKALFDGQLLDVHFTRSFYKHILGVKVTYHDIEAIDPDYFKNLKWMLENDISDVLDLTFSIDADEEKLILYERTEVTDYELVPNGRNIRVTEENKHEYVDLIAEHRLTTAIRPQINAFLEGFSELIPRNLISIFHDKELELLISGLPDIDLDDMRANTEYSGYSAGSPVIHWFWEVVQCLSKEDKARLLQFVTGTSKVPLEGFSALQGISGSQKFQIHKAYGSADHLPSAHTCFNQLDLPEYPSKEHLEEKLLLAIHEANEGFGFG